MIFRKKSGVELNMALAETYYFNLKVCSDDEGLNAAEIQSCCGKTGSQARLKQNPKSLTMNFFQKFGSDFKPIKGIDNSRCN